MKRRINESTLRNIIRNTICEMLEAEENDDIEGLIAQHNRFEDSTKRSQVRDAWEHFCETDGEYPVCRDSFGKEIDPYLGDEGNKSDDRYFGDGQWDRVYDYDTPGSLGIEAQDFDTDYGVMARDPQRFASKK